MKNINIILILLLVTFGFANGADESVDNNITKTEVNTAPVEEEIIIEGVDKESTFDVNALKEDINETMVVEENMSEFEKLFVNHSAYRYYEKAIEELYKSNYKAAYENAMKAKEIVDNTDKPNEQVIALPYMPNYLRETAYTPKRIYYKIVKAKPYELKRVITKAKLISPPVASIIIKRTSTYMEIITRNYGDLPLDDFELLLNDESIVKYEKVLPNEKKIIRIDAAPVLYEISFKEKYGFAPKSIMLSEGE